MFVLNEALKSYLFKLFLLLNRRGEKFYSVMSHLSEGLE